MGLAISCSVHSYTHAESREFLGIQLFSSISALYKLLSQIAKFLSPVFHEPAAPLRLVSFTEHDVVPLAYFYVYFHANLSILDIFCSCYSVDIKHQSIFSDSFSLSDSRPELWWSSLSCRRLSVTPLRNWPGATFTIWISNWFSTRWTQFQNVVTALLFVSLRTADEMQVRRNRSSAMN